MGLWHTCRRTLIVLGIINSVLAPVAENYARQDHAVSSSVVVPSSVKASPDCASVNLAWRHLDERAVLTRKSAPSSPDSTASLALPSRESETAYPSSPWSLVQ